MNTQTNMNNKPLLEHVNLTVADPDATAKWLSRMFDWSVRWAGDSIHGGYTVHVGDEHQYLALYRHPDVAADKTDNHKHVNGLNHIGIVVADLDAAEARVVAEGFEPFNHADYEPGRRFYFLDDNGVEYEIISYH